MSSLSSSQRANLAAVASRLASPGKGLLAADEWPAVLQNRFDKINVEATAETSFKYREMVFTTPGVEEHLSGVILWRESLTETNTAGVTLPQILLGRGILPGVNVDNSDLATVPLGGGAPGETCQTGLDSLESRAALAVKAGCQFAKWRCPYIIDASTGAPTAQALEEHAHSTARYVTICQAAGLVPIVEPDISMAGNHSIEVCESVTERVLQSIYARLHAYGAFLEGTVLKPNLVTCGLAHTDTPNTPTSVAQATLRVLQRTVPVAVPGVFFLSGGLSESEASAFLNALNQCARTAKCPWHISFCFGRALQHSCLVAWKGLDANHTAAQDAFHARTLANSNASKGQL